ncbi:MAG: endolytic transglycosylase MltG [Alphaproteobacteria bacterium]|nr:endolytic transglycosylase MltG [Alphaproteobacteria bacterium]
MRMLGRIAVCLVLLLIAGGVVGGGFWQRYTQPGPSARPTTLVVPKGAGLEEVAVRLAEAGLITDPRVFAIGTTIDGRSRRFKFGEFEFPAHVSARGAAEVIVAGRTIQRRLTIPEGLTVKQVVALINRAEGFEGSITVPSEGTLLPDTWFYSWGDSREKFVERQRQAMTRLLQEQWRQRMAGLPLKTPHEALILASIVEKETGVAAERTRVAAVYINRLKRGMRLQADPTVVYGINDGAGPLDRPISRADLENPHAWNTYAQDGLPPTPIANPGRAAIEAVMRPAQTDELYFVADGSGGHVFSRNLADHNRAVERLRALERQRAARGN